MMNDCYSRSKAESRLGRDGSRSIVGSRYRSLFWVFTFVRDLVQIAWTLIQWR